MFSNFGSIHRQVLNERPANGFGHKFFPKIAGEDVVNVFCCDESKGGYFDETFT